MAGPATQGKKEVVKEQKRKNDTHRCDAHATNPLARCGVLLADPTEHFHLSGVSACHVILLWPMGLSLNNACFDVFFA